MSRGSVGSEECCTPEGFGESRRRLSDRRTEAVAVDHAPPMRWKANAMTSAAVWQIEPSGPLAGDVEISGSKNAVTKLMVASLLAESPSTVVNAPRIGDVDITAEMLRSVGAGVSVLGSTVIVDPAAGLDGKVPVTYSGLNRVPILLVGPLLHRVGEVSVPMVGGD